MMPRSIAIGGFSNLFYGWGNEDVDFGTRIRTSGIHSWNNNSLVLREHDYYSFHKESCLHGHIHNGPPSGADENVDLLSPLGTGDAGLVDVKYDLVKTFQVSPSVTHIMISLAKKGSRLAFEQVQNDPHKTNVGALNNPLI